MKELVLFLEIIGTIAFAISGAIVAFEEKMDIFGVAVLGMTTAVGGGIIRDLLLGIIPPTAFVKPIYAFVALATSLICFVNPIRKRLKNNNKILLFTDSIGLSIFTVVGFSIAIGRHPSNLFLAIFISVLTATGGGVLRDIFANKTPSIFVTHFYATASLIGAIMCAILWGFLGESLTMIVGAIVVQVLRILAAKYHWNLPK